MKHFISLGLSVIIAVSTAPKASAQADWIQKGWEIFGGGIKAGGSVEFGPLNHQVFWGFCSNNGYRSYYDRGGFVICGYEEYNRQDMDPQGVVFYYDQVCEGYFGNSAAYNNGVCVSQSY
jgi:hypothetical protein